MLAFLPETLKGILSALLIVLNTVLWTFCLYPLALLKALVSYRPFRRAMTDAMVWIAETWTFGNNLNFALFQKIRWNIRGVEDLRRDASYVVCSNHQSWVDIIVLQKSFNRRIPFLRFFLKQELIRVPFLGLAWWALDYPFMKRYTREYLERHPEKRGEDLATTRRACEAFRGSHISVINFLEGTRFTRAKHNRQKSPYRHLLLPKAGGLVFVLECMGDQFDALLDVTIRYPRGVVNFWDLLCGRMTEVEVHVQKRPIPRELLDGSYLEDEAFRERAHAWVRNLWREKDERLSSTAGS